MAKRTLDPHTLSEDLIRVDLEKGFGSLGRALGRRLFPDARKDPVYSMLGHSQKGMNEADKALAKTLENEMGKTGDSVQRLASTFNRDTSKFTRDVTRSNDRIISSLTRMMAGISKIQVKEHHAEIAGKSDE